MANETAKTFPIGTVIIATQQTGGKGRYGRFWESPVGNLYLSAVVQDYGEQSSLLAFVAGVSVAEALADFDVRLKWPNDVLLNSKKVCGILLERKDENYMIAGIGVNINSFPILSDACYEAVSLKAAGISVTREEFLECFLEKFNQYLEKIRKKELNTIKQMWKDYAKGINKNIEVDNFGRKICGKFVGIDDKGALVIKTENGNEIVCAGDIIYKEE